MILTMNIIYSSYFCNFRFTWLMLSNETTAQSTAQICLLLAIYRRLLQNQQSKALHFMEFWTIYI